MTERLISVTAGLSIALILLVLASIRRAHIRVEYSVSWLVASTVVLVLSLSPVLLHGLASLVGFEDPPLALLFVMLCTFLLVFYRVSVVISDLKDANIALTQRLAILEYRLQRAHEKPQPPAAG